MKSHTKLLTAFFASATSLGMLGAQPAAPVPATAPYRVEPLASPAGIDSESPQLTTEGNRVILSWIEANEDHITLKFAERTPTGWSDPRAVRSNESLWVNAADVPMVRALSGGTLVAAWPEANGGDDESSDLKVSRSTDGGRTWSTPVSPHHDGTKTQHGFASILPSASGGFIVVWLDGRATRPGARDPSQAGSMTLRAAEFDAKGVQRGETLIDARVCDCCPLSTAVASGAPVVAYRDRSAEEIRDIAVTRLVSGKWTTPATVNRDGWKIEGCPVNGPAIAANGADVVVGWFTGASGSGRAFAAWSGDGGQTFGAPIRVDDGAAIGRMQVRVLADGGAAISWIESFESRSQLRIRRVGRDGARSASMVLTEGLGASHPKLTLEREGLLAAWVESTRGTTRIRTTRLVPSR